MTWEDGQAGRGSDVRWAGEGYGAEQTADRDKKEQRNMRAGSNCKSIWGQLIWVGGRSRGKGRASRNLPQDLEGRRLPMGNRVNGRVTDECLKAGWRRLLWVLWKTTGRS